MKYIKLKSPGLLSTVQDQGRPQLQHLGIPACGAMDYVSHAVANILVGNSEDAAALECTWSGPVLEFNSTTQIALAGATTEARLNGYSVPMYTTIIVAAGDVLDLSSIKSGARLYMAVAGGINVPQILESRSTYLPIQFGHLDRKLKIDDHLPLTELNMKINIIRLNNKSPLRYDGLAGTKIIRLVPGPQIDYFNDIAQQILVNNEFTLSAQSDRMGLRFEGEKVELANTKPMISDGIPLGAMQITRGGQPIIMMADRQPTGGYPKIAKVFQSDLAILAQLRPGDRVKFQWHTLEESRESYLRIKGLLHSLAEKKAPQPVKCYRVYISGKLYQTTISENHAYTK